MTQTDVIYTDTETCFLRAK